MKGVRDQHYHHGGPNARELENKHMLAAVFPLNFTKNNAMLHFGCGLRLQDKTLHGISNYCNNNWVSFFGIMLET